MIFLIQYKNAKLRLHVLMGSVEKCDYGSVPDHLDYIKGTDSLFKLTGYKAVVDMM